MKKRILSMLLVIVMVLSMVPVSALAAGELTITSTKGSAVIGKDKLTLSVTGGEAADTFSWSAEGADVTLAPSTDTKTCTLEGNTQGTVTVTVKTADEAKSGTKSFQIYLQPEDLKIIDADTKEAAVDELKVGQTLNLGFTCQNLENIQGKSLKWEVTDVTGTDVMTIDQKSGALEAKNAGTAKVTLALNGGRAEQTFTVSPVDPPAPKEMTVTPATAEMYPNRSLKLVASVEDVTWESSDETVATVSANGEVKSLKVGPVTITAKKVGYNDATCEISIVPNAFRITDSEGNKVEQIKAGQTVNLQVWDLSNTAQPDFKWDSSDVSIATVDTTGKLTGVAPGSVKVTATKGGCTVTCTVTVEQKSLTIKEANNKDSFYVGKTYNLKAYDADNNVISIAKWESSNPNHVEIDGTGKMTVLVAGVNKEVTITATPSSNAYAAAKFTVRVQANSLVITAASGDEVSAVNVNETVELVARDGNGDIVTGVQWVCSDTNKAAFISDGLLKGIRQSSTPVTITVSKDSYTPGTLEISVVVKSLEIRNSDNEAVTEVDMAEDSKMQLKAVDGDGKELTVVWSSRDSRVTVDNTGLVTAGKSTRREAVAIEASLPGYETKTVKVTVRPEPVFTAVKLAGDESNRLAVGETRKMIALDADGKLRRRRHLVRHRNIVKILPEHRRGVAGGGGAAVQGNDPGLLPLPALLYLVPVGAEGLHYGAHRFPSRGGQAPVLLQQRPLALGEHLPSGGKAVLKKNIRFRLKAVEQPQHHFLLGKADVPLVIAHRRGGNAQHLRQLGPGHPQRFPAGLHPFAESHGPSSFQFFCILILSNFLVNVNRILQETCKLLVDITRYL